MVRRTHLLGYIHWRSLTHDVIGVDLANASSRTTP